MDRHEITKEIHQQFKTMGVTKNYADSKAVVDVVLNTISSNIIQGKTINLYEFGTFESMLKRIPDIRQKGNIIQKWVITFKASFTIKKKLNEKK